MSKPSGLSVGPLASLVSIRYATLYLSYRTSAQPADTRYAIRPELLLKTALPQNIENIRPESLSELCDTDVEQYIQNRGRPLFYYLRTFQFSLRQQGLTQAPGPDLLTPRLAGVPAATAHQVRAYLATLRRRNYSPATIKSIMYLLTAFVQALPPERQAQLSLVTDPFS